MTEARSITMGPIAPKRLQRKFLRRMNEKIDKMLSGYRTDRTIALTYWNLASDRDKWIRDFIKQHQHGEHARVCVQLQIAQSNPAYAQY